MADRVLEAWETNAARPFVTIRAGGPLNGVVTITAIAGGKGRNLVRATWTQDGEARSESLEAATYEMARAIANAAANQFAVGKRPHLARD
jgi:metal-dependent amidase/aminoacylase/carboxypeptidase family protein